METNESNEFAKYIKVNQSKLIKSLLCFVSYAGVGAIISLHGAALLDYQILTDQSFQSISYMIQVRSIGYVVGTLSATSIEKYVKQACILSVANILLGSALIVSPWFMSLAPLLVATFIVGFGYGIVETYLYVYIGHLWKFKSTIYLQILQFCYDTGALIAPIITSPFLLPMDPDEYNQQTAQINLTNSSDVRIFTKDDILIQYPHLILGLLLILVGAAFGFVNHTNDDEKQESGPTSSQVLKWDHFVATACIALIINFIFGVDSLASSLGPAFGVKSGLKMTKQDAALLATAYWTASCVFQLVLIPASLFIKENYLILTNAGFLIAGSLIMSQSADKSSILTVISFILMGLGSDPCLSLCIGLIQKYFTVPCKMSSIIFLCGAIGESLHPWVVANFLEARPTFYTDYFAFIATVNSVLCLFYVTFVTKIMSKSPFDTL